MKESKDLNTALNDMPEQLKDLQNFNRNAVREKERAALLEKWGELLEKMAELKKQITEV